MDLNELQSLHIKELTELAQKLKIEGGVAGLNKQELTVKILEENAKKNGDFTVIRIVKDHLIRIVFKCVNQKIEILIKM